jgi:CRP/FNR family transcriptional regulator, cyclic AMP receptor protein
MARRRFANSERDCAFSRLPRHRPGAIIQAGPHIHFDREPAFQMTANDIFCDFAGMGFSSGLSETTLHRLAEMAQLRSHAAGDVLFQEGAHCSDVLVVRSGKIQLSVRVPGRGSVPILTLGPGQIVGWSPILGSGEMSTSALALAATEVFALPGDRLREFCEHDHEFGYRFMERMARALARRLVATRLQLLDLFAGGAPQNGVREEARG